MPRTLDIGERVVLHNRYCNGENVVGELVEIVPLYNVKHRVKNLNQWRSKVMIETDKPSGGIERYCLGAFVEFREKRGALRVNDGERLSLTINEDVPVGLVA